MSRQARTEEELIDYLLANSFKTTSGCIIWLGCTTEHGYGKVNWRRKVWKLHRLAYHLEHPSEVLDNIRHTCDEPSCWNVEHLINGTFAENHEDKIIKGRHAHGTNHNFCKLTEGDVLAIRAATETYAVIAEKFNTSQANVSFIKNRLSWRHLP